LQTVVVTAVVVVVVVVAAVLQALAKWSESERRYNGDELMIGEKNCLKKLEIFKADVMIACLAATGRCYFHIPL